MSTGEGERTSLVRVRNPWGDKNEWKGDWSDGDSKWEMVENETKKEMGLHYMYDGEFWIEFFTDFCREFEVRNVDFSCNFLTHPFQEVSICTLGPDFDQDGKVDMAKYMKIIFGQVKRNS